MTMMDASAGVGASAETPPETELAPDEEAYVDPFADLPEDRDLKQAAWRGWRRRCPACGTGPLMKGYLKVRDTCTVCGEELHHHRADDGPAYLSILVVGHVMAPLLGIAFVEFRPNPMVLGSVFAIAAVALTLWLLPRFKGLMVGFQWAKRLHGFADSGPVEPPDPAEADSAA
jgi:uncharacterized protein (DUF983 family)